MPRSHAHLLLGGGIAVAVGMLMPAVSLVFKQISLFDISVENMFAPTSALDLLGSGWRVGWFLQWVWVVAVILASLPIRERFTPPAKRGATWAKDQRLAAKVALWGGITNLIVTLYILIRLNNATSGLAWGALVLLGGIAAQAYGAVLYARSIKTAAAVLAATPTATPTSDAP